jgi:hypothetical protein
VKQIGSFLLTSQARGSQQDLFFLTKPKFQTLGVALCKRPRYSPAKTKKMILCRNVRSGFRILILFLFPRFGCAYLLIPYWGESLALPTSDCAAERADVAFRYQKKSLSAWHFCADGELRKINNEQRANPTWHSFAIL